MRLDPVVFQVTKEITRSLYTFKQENPDIFITDIAFNFVERNSHFELVKIKVQRGIRLHQMNNNKISNTLTESPTKSDIEVKTSVIILKKHPLTLFKFTRL